MSKNLIIKDNALISASYHLDLIEQRLILLAIAQSRRVGEELTATTKLKISVSDYIDTYSLQGRSVYENIKKACKTLFERQFTYTEQQEKGVRVATSRWVSEIAYNDKTTAIDITFAPSVVPLITMLERHFTSYNLEQVAGLNSKYAIRLYEIVIAWKSNGKTNQIGLEQLRDRLGVFDDEYQRMELFKRKVLDKSVAEINEKTEINLSYKQHKNGRKIVGFTFTVKQKSKPKKLKTQEQERDPKTPDIFDNLTDKEREIIAQKNAYADQIGATEQHRQNLIKKALEQHRQAEQSEQERKQREKAERLAQEQQDKERLELAKRQFEQILASDGLINAYIANNIVAKYLSGLQKIRFEQGDFRGVFEMERYKFERLHELQRLNLKFLD
ncbi:replication initiation protein RepM [Moraxella nonliquefaciens]|uniref:RepB family plasmid replication initiator protein n=1 Tax=Moraxella nonliquefaciens TaxID=478 RepID=A0A1B8QI18_MORNO|nr:replication initiation protein RepM [Moraxella nonliquefaciens]OBX82991.1 hypothetical protein A7456_06190 [Moraxella nonliquefaciens]QPT43638.1 RepB family plasmid replication initiator protein [Moraxella nonliquefaciens]QQC28824.1 RepB family plasmid replication initiator protein [Moraxella nonliquefaciens]